MCLKDAEESVPEITAKEVIGETMETTAHLLERPESGPLTTPNAGEDPEQQELSFIACGDEKWYSHCGGQLGGFSEN